VRLGTSAMVSFAPQGDRRSQADVAQLVERNLAKVEVASSSLVVRSERKPKPPRWVGREARQRTANPSTRVRIPYPPRTTYEHHPGAIGAVVARFLDTEEVTGSNPVSPTSTFPQVSPTMKPLSRTDRGASFMPLVTSWGTNARRVPHSHPVGAGRRGCPSLARHRSGSAATASGRQSRAPWCCLAHMTRNHLERHPGAAHQGDERVPQLARGPLPRDETRLGADVAEHAPRVGRVQHCPVRPAEDQPVILE
jgi:hypothetical protein